MVTRDYPYFDTFRRLTEEEESVGLLSGSNIGFRDGWNSLLRERDISFQVILF